MNKRSMISLCKTFFCFRLVLFTILLGNALFVQAQINISFGDKLQSNQIPGSGIDEASWVILNNESTELARGDAESIFDFVFKSPGSYIIKFKHVHNGDNHSLTCKHYALPDEVTVMVSSQKIIYNTEQIRFSEEIIGGKSVEGIIMYVPVEIIDVSGNNGYTLNENIVSYGIKSTIFGRLNKEQLVLAPGNHVLQYQLKGTAQSGTFIGFDFVNANGVTFSYGFNKPLK